MSEEVLTHLLPLSLLDVIPGGVLQVSLHLRDKGAWSAPQHLHRDLSRRSAGGSQRDGDGGGGVC
ncbi:hypothetical protein EYF80_030775 [Liparis tanakae]|uniref:Uncharacterized protein n=1 Tax=Liparis tanakae TaxID=230148 RepID=A0A4Z2GZI5_9TELE|nr:hypothetical protein EYF80_030775 [Liparis tanakae]